MANLQCVKGLAEFQRAIEQFPKNIGRNVLRGAVNAGATVLRKRAVELAPEYEGDDKRVDPGRIKRAIYQKQIPELSNELLQTFFVGVRRGKKQQLKVVRGKVTNLDAYYWSWLEFGHFYVPPRPKGITQEKHREAHKTGTSAIWIEPRSFMRPAFAIAKDDAIQAMVAYLEKRIPLEAQKLGLTMK
jgi:HK97 gp10 family phage protein